jgi:hypothetical protein
MDGIIGQKALKYSQKFDKMNGYGAGLTLLESKKTVGTLMEIEFCPMRQVFRDFIHQIKSLRMKVYVYDLLLVSRQFKKIPYVYGFHISIIFMSFCALRMSF